MRAGRSPIRMFETLNLRKRIGEHDEALERVERRLKALELEWTDALDRLKTMMGRVLKERQTAQRLREEAQPTQTTLTDEDVAAGHNAMGTRQQQINEQILARRNRQRGTQ